MIFPGADGDTAQALAEEIRERIVAGRFPGERKLPGGKLTVSLGVAAGESRERRRLLAEADRQLYLAKRAGRNKTRGGK